MYPPDKFCDFLYYCEVVIKSNFLRAAKVQASWRAFQDMAPSYQRAQPGVSFDFRFIAKDKLMNAAQNVSGLAQKNIKHFGVLNIITVQTRLRQYVTEMKDVFETFKTIQGNDYSRKTIIAFGLFDYSLPSAFITLKNVVKMVADTYKADTVIAISSVNSIEKEVSCFSAPPIAIDNSNRYPEKKFPKLIKHVEVVNPSTVYTNQHTIVGLSYEMGVLVYVMYSAPSSAKSIPYLRCKRIGVTSLDAGLKGEIAAFEMRWPWATQG
ncbi:uncharacterized protein LOC144134333 [Amblyomma americanum]